MSRLFSVTYFCEAWPMASVAARIRAIISDYRGYVRQQACTPLKQRMLRNDMLTRSWALAAMLSLCASFVLGRWFWLALPIPVALFVCGGWSSARFLRYAREFDRTPPEAPWAKSEEAQMLFLALDQFAAGPIRTLTPQTRLQNDLGMTGQDMTALYAILREQAELDDRAVARARRGGITISELLESVHVRGMPSAS